MWLRTQTGIVWWLVASLLLYLLAVNLGWRIRSWQSGRGSRLGSLARRIEQLSPLVVAVGFAYYLGVPYAALLLGALDPRLAGLVGVDWPRSLGIGAVFGLGALVLLMLGRWYYRRMLEDPACAEIGEHAVEQGAGEGSEGSAEAPKDGNDKEWPRVVWRVVCQEAHWGFYRSAASVVTGNYIGVWAGLGLVLVEWVADPGWRAGWRGAEVAERHAIDIALALTVAALFLYTGNLWLCAVVHLALALVLMR